MAQRRDGSRVVDVLLEWPGGKVVVEVDGPTHFLEDADGARTRLSTSTLLRNRTLQVWDYRVASIPVAGWGDLRSPAFRALVVERLRAAGVPL
jgi:RAP domain